MVAKHSGIFTETKGRFGALLVCGLCIAMVALTSLSQSVHAHQAKAAITEVLFNPRTGNLEVAHRFIAHDAEHAARLLFDKNADIIKSAEVREQFATYVTESFSISSNGKAIPLTLLGVELDRTYLWVYQETVAPTDVTAFKIQHRAMSDLWSDQINTVNVKRDGDVQTVTFVGGELAKSVDVPGS